ncbi:MAG TPA: ABC transporter transmembrane domain-containing protein, partial [Clostridia bacterium]
MRTVVKLIGMAKKYWKYMIIGMIAIIVLTGCQLTAPMIVRELTSLIQNRDSELGQKALRLALILAAIYLAQAGCTFLRSYITHYAAWNFVSDMRVRIYNHLQKLSLQYYHDKQTGQIMSRASNDVQL